MSRDSWPVKLAALLPAIVITFMIFQASYEESLTIEITDFDGLFAVVDKRYSKISGTLVISLRNNSESLSNLTKEDFQWFINDCAMGTVCAVYFSNGKVGKWDTGDSVHIVLKTREDLSGSKIRIIIRGSSVEFRV